MLDSVEGDFTSVVGDVDNHNEDDDDRSNDDSAGLSRSSPRVLNGRSIGRNNRPSNDRSSHFPSRNTITSVSNREMIATTRSDKKEKTKTKECVICYERNVSMVLIPCGHPCLCESCSSTSTMNKIKWKCPECRAGVHQVAKFFGRIAVDE